MPHELRTLHLFAGAGGGLLADLILGHTPIGAVEFDPYCCAVLRERAADGWFPDLRVHEGDVRLFDPSEYTGRVDCIAAGFPCTELASPEIAQELAKKRAAVSTEKSSASLAWFDQDSFSWKTSQRSLVTDWEPFSQTWPRSGMTQNGVAFELPIVGRRTSGTDGGYLPTPSAIEGGPMPDLSHEPKKNSRNYSAKTGRHYQVTLRRYTEMWPTPTVPNGGRSCAHVTDWRGKTAYHNGKKVQVGLEHAAKHWPTPRAQDRCQHNSQDKGMALSLAVKQWPTPRANDAGKRGNFDVTNPRNGLPAAEKLWATPTASMGGPEPEGATGRKLTTQVGGQLNPTWVEYLMAWPLAFTVSKHWETDKSRSKPRSRGKSSEGRDA